MTTTFYFAAAETASPVAANGVYLNTSIGAPYQVATGQGNVYAKTLVTSMALAQKNLSIPIGPTDTANKMFWGRFQSAPLAAQTIPAQTWTILPNVGEGALTSDTFHWTYLVVYRPSTQQVVGTIIPGTSAVGVEWPGGQSSGNWYTIAGPAITCADGDVLVFEAWSAGVVPTMTGTQLWGLDDTGSRFTSPYDFTFYTPPAGPVATLSVTEGPDAVVSDASVVTPPNNSTLTRTEANDTVVASASSPVTANLSRTEAQDTLNATAGAPPALATLTRTEDPDTVVSAVGATAGAALTRTEAPDTVVASASSTITANLTRTEAPDTVVGAATSPVTANLSVINDPDTVVSDASVGPLPPAIATLAVQEAPDTVASTAAVTQPLVGTLQEDFEGGTGKWDLFLTNGTLVFSGGTSVHDILTAVTGNQSVAISKNFYSLLGSGAFIKLVQPMRTVGDAVGIESAFGVIGSGTGNRAMWRLGSNGLLEAITRANWNVVVRFAEPTYFANASTYAWLRISERAGTTYWESAPSTASNPPIEADWVVRATLPTASLPSNFSTVQVIYHAYMDPGTAGVPTQPLKFDGLNIAANAAAGESQGSLDTIEAPDTLASTASVTSGPSNATLDQTEDPDTLVSSASAPATATLIRTEAPDTIVATAGALAGVTFTRTEAPDTVVASASSSVVSNLTRTEAPDTLAATASSPIFSNLSVQEAPDTLSATVSGAVTAALSRTEAPDTVSSAAVVLPFPVINASLNVLEEDDRVASASGSPAAIVDAFLIEAPDTLVATASSTIGATLARTEAADVVSATAGGIAGASLARTEAADSLAASATAPATANLSKQEADDTLASITRSVVAVVLAIQEAPDTLVSIVSVSSGSIGGLTVTEDRDTLSATATVINPVSNANLSVTEQGDTLAGYIVQPKKRVVLFT